MDHKIYDRALKIVRDEYDKHFVGGYGPGFLQMESNADATVEKNTDKFAKWLEESLKGKKPEVLENAKDEDIRRAYIEGGDPTSAGKKIEFSAFKDIIEPPKGKRSWYDMDTEQLRYAMKDRGYKPEEMPEFLEKLSEHQQNYDIGKAVDEGLSGPTGALTTILAPVASREAVRQSYDKGSAPNDWALRIALGADAAALGGMLLAPGMKAFSGADELANIVKLGATDAGLEGGRQFVDIINNGGVPTEENLKAPVYAGVAAATVPALSSFLGSYLSRGGSEAAKPFAQGFRRGTRGGMDPVTVEAENIKQQLIRAKAASKKGYETATDYVKKQSELGNFDPTSDGYAEGWAGFDKVDAGAEWANGQKILMDLGYPSRESMLIEKSMKTQNNLVRDADKKVFNKKLASMERNPANKPHGIEKQLDEDPRGQYLDPSYVMANAHRFKLPNKIDVGSSQGLKGRVPGEPIYVEDIIGWRPGTQYGWRPPEYQLDWYNGITGYVPEYMAPTVEVDKVIESMRNPLASVAKRYGMVDDFSAEQAGKVIDRYAGSAPEHAKMARSLGKEPIPGLKGLEKLFGKTNAERYVRGMALGGFISGAGTRLEPAGISLKDLLTNPYGFVKSKRQYAEEKNREKIKDEQLKKAIEEALKGGK